MSDDNKRWMIDPRLVDPSGGQGDMDPLFPGYEGFPFRGIPYDRKEDDPSYMQPKIAARVHVEILEMHKEEDRARMEKIYTMMTNGTAVISVEERHWDEEIKSWRVMLRWADVYAYNPQAAKGNGNGRSR